jgi:Ala-tRNA(Pro) deacylase
MADDRDDRDDRYVISLESRFDHLELIDVPALVASAPAPWFNQTLTRVDGNVVRLGVVEGEFHWHRHDDEDEFFFVLDGELTVDVEGRSSLTLGPHQGCTVPKGTTHRTRAATRTVLLMSSGAGVIPTGDPPGSTSTTASGSESGSSSTTASSSESGSTSTAESGSGSAEMYDRLVELLVRHGATYRLIDHAPEGRTEVVSALRGNPLGAAAKCMIVMVKIDKKRRRHVLAVVPGDRHVDLGAVKALYGGRYAGFADTETAERLSGCETGTILPFVWTDELDLVVDPGLYVHDTIYFNAGRLDRSIALASADHRRIAAPREATIGKPVSP